MQDGDLVEWGNPASPTVGRLLEVRAHVPARRAGTRLGSWTNKFYKTRALVEVHHKSGHKGLAWVVYTRLRPLPDTSKEYHADSVS